VAKPGARVWVCDRGLFTNAATTMVTAITFGAAYCIRSATNLGPWGFCGSGIGHTKSRLSTGLYSRVTRWDSVTHIDRKRSHVKLPLAGEPCSSRSLIGALRSSCYVHAALLQRQLLSNIERFRKELMGRRSLDHRSSLHPSIHVFALRKHEHSESGSFELDT
jgi:hypothetical protein